MSSGHHSYGRFVLVGGLLAALFAACAEGTQLPSETSSSGSGGGGGSGAGGEGPSIPPGQVGGTCDDNTPCVEGTCTKVGPTKYCTVPCPPQCPDGTYCSIINGDSMCVPDVGNQCHKCETVLQCPHPSDTCLTAPLGDKFCARDCTTMSDCPNGFTCVEGAKYPDKGGGDMPDGGAPDSGSDGGGIDGGDGGVDAGPPKPTAPYKFCVPNSGFSCPCTDQRDGVKRSCKNTNMYGTCGGMETCDGKASKWADCSAQTPAAETCNAKDDDCDGQVDEDDPNNMCASQGPQPPHASYACTAGKCGLGACDPGWTSFPPGPLKDGCACPTEMGEPNDACANATYAGSVSDIDGSSITLTGTLGGQNDVDFWALDTVDTTETNTNSYHVSIDFTAPMPNNEFVFDVIRGDPCVDVPSGPSTGLLSYDWCVDGKSADGLSGEAVCANDGSQPVHCNDNSTKYYVRVSRKLGATGTCTQYSIVVTAKGGDPCDFTKQCP